MNFKKINFMQHFYLNKVQQNAKLLFKFILQFWFFLFFTYGLLLEEFIY